MGSNSAIFGLVLVAAIIKSGLCDNVTNKYPSGNFETRRSRLLTFNTGKDDQIHVELDFSVPFLSIPIKPSFDAAQGSFANLNIGAVALAGMMAFGAAIVIPATYHLFDKPFGSIKNPYAGDSYSNRYRNDENGGSTIWTAMAALDKALSENNIDSTSCMQRAICWTVKNSNSNLLTGRASSSDKIIDGLATNGYVKQLVDGSVFQAAIDSGLNGVNCSHVYSQCKINQKSIQMFGKQFISAIYNRK